MNNLMLNIAIMLIGSSLVSLAVCVLYLKNKNQMKPNIGNIGDIGQTFENEDEMQIISTPSKSDKYVVRSKEIEDEER